MHKFTTDHEFRVFGLRRGGNHAIIGWLASAMPNDSVYYFNDVSCDYARLYNTIVIGPSDFKAGTVARKLIKYPNWASNKKCIIQSYEDQPLDIIKEVNKQNNGNIKNKVNIMIIRDPFNMVASRLELYRKGNYFVEVTPQVMKLWESYANEYLGNTNVLSEDGTKTVCVNYNKWHIDSTYRDEIARQIGIDPTLADINMRMFFGGGSSFNNTELSNNPENTAKEQLEQQQKSLKSDEKNSDFNQRWFKYKDDPDFERFTINETYLTLMDTIFY